MKGVIEDLHTRFLKSYEVCKAVKQSVFLLLLIYTFYLSRTLINGGVPLVIAYCFIVYVMMSTLDEVREVVLITFLIKLRNYCRQDKSNKNLILEVTQSFRNASLYKAVWNALMEVEL